MGVDMGQFPLPTGHEASGIVRAVGSGVTRLAVGDRVAAMPRSLDMLRELYLHPAEFCHKLPDGVSLEEGASGLSETGTRANE